MVYEFDLIPDVYGLGWMGSAKMDLCPTLCPSPATSLFFKNNYFHFCGAGAQDFLPDFQRASDWYRLRRKRPRYGPLMSAMKKVKEWMHAARVSRTFTEFGPHCCVMIIRLCENSRFALREKSNSEQKNKQRNVNVNAAAIRYTWGAVTSSTSPTWHAAMLEVFLIWMKTELNAEIWPFFFQDYSQTAHFDWHIIIHTSVHKFTASYCVATEIPPKWRHLFLQTKLRHYHPMYSRELYGNRDIGNTVITAVIPRIFP